MEKEDRHANVCRLNSLGQGQETQGEKILSLCVYIPGTAGTSHIFTHEKQMRTNNYRVFENSIHLTLKKML